MIAGAAGRGAVSARDRGLAAPSAAARRAADDCRTRRRSGRRSTRSVARSSGSRRATACASPAAGCRPTTGRAAKDWRPDPHEAILLLHGWSGSIAPDLVEYGPFLRRTAGVLGLDFRGHGESDDAPTTFGLHEVEDVAGALAWLGERGITRVALVGTSMGGDRGHRRRRRPRRRLADGRRRRPDRAARRSSKRRGRGSSRSSPNRSRPRLRSRSRTGLRRRPGSGGSLAAPDVRRGDARRRRRPRGRPSRRASSASSSRVPVLLIHGGPTRRSRLADGAAAGRARRPGGRALGRPGCRPQGQSRRGRAGDYETTA